MDTAAEAYKTEPLPNTGQLASARALTPPVFQIKTYDVQRTLLAGGETDNAFLLHPH